VRFHLDSQTSGFLTEGFVMSRCLPSVALRLAAFAVVAGTGGAPLAAADSAAGLLEEVVVTARLREQSLDEVAASISVLPAAVIRERQANHFEELLNLTPNVNFSAGASRGRFVQIRGVGERSQFVDPVDPSVGLYIDGIDFSGMGNAGTLFDVAQVEVLRGPQGTAFGASAMAGLLNIRSERPGDQFEARLQGGLSQYGGNTLGAVAGGPLAEGLGARVALHRHRSDGYIENDYLGSDDSNDIDESTVRARLDWQAGERLALGLTLLRVDADNGYDAFSLDNTRHTLSDQPGRDRQRSDALALNASWQASPAFDLELLATASSSDLDYGYDEDWSNPQICAGTPCEGWEYASTDRYLRDARSASIDLRLVSRDARAVDWVAGIYLTRRDTALERRFFDFAAGYPPPAARFDSDYEAGHVAAYGELSWAASERLQLVGGLRMQRFEARYSDSLQLDVEPGENLWGGQLSAQYQMGDAAMVYALVARGYKAGGVNGEAVGKAQQAALDPSIIDFLRTRSEFEAETLYNYELGYRTRIGETLWLRAALFLMQREDVQLKAWYNEGPQFVGYTDNAASGSNHGLEIEADWRAHERLRFGATLGLLETEIEDFIANDPDAGFVDKSGREQAQAPAWQFSLSAELRLYRQAFARAEYEGRDSYYMSDSDDQRSDAYRLLHLSLGWRGERVEASAWVRNALDQDYAVHGFYFGNDPRKFYINEPYYQYGPPRVAGVSLSYAL
jgi:iron complex outermembrane recepter protein